jgi:hypothetical protein
LCRIIDKDGTSPRSRSVCKNLPSKVCHLLEYFRFISYAELNIRFVCSQVSRVVKLWRESLEKVNKKKAAEALADPAEYENLFPDFKHVCNDI